MTARKPRMSAARSIAERIADIEKECFWVWGSSGITLWERERLAEWKNRDHLSEKQEAVLQAIEDDIPFAPERDRN